MNYYNKMHIIVDINHSFKDTFNKLHKNVIIYFITLQNNVNGLLTLNISSYYANT